MASIRRSDLRSSLALARDWSLILGLILVAEWVQAWWVTLICVFGIGLMQFALGEALLHAASHYTLFRDRRRNDWAGAVCALPFLTTVRDWRAEHLNHHARLGTIEDHVTQDYAVHRLTDSAAHIGWVWFGKPLVGLTALRHVRGLGDVNSSRGWIRIAAFWAPILIVCAREHLALDLVVYWFVPQLTVYATLLHWSEIADHYRTRAGSRSRTGRVHNWLFHNNGYHAVHHRYPSVPFHQLPQAHRALEGQDSDVTRGWWGAWRQISRAPEPVPERWASFWPTEAADFGIGAGSHSRGRHLP